IVADARGNNRLDSLVNIIETGRAGCLFLIPGVDETLRVNGRAFISTDTGLLEASRGDKNPAKSVIVIEIEQLYMHCAKALMRSKLWLDTARVSRAELPTMAQIINDQLGVTQGELETQEQMLARYREQL
ncbi:MAG: pyridoxamine 5'-phosphate oxidase family protein, partial [Pseudomonadales bacterium]